MGRCAAAAPSPARRAAGPTGASCTSAWACRSPRPSMTRTCRPCSSSAQPDRWPGQPGSGEWRRGRPSPPRPASCSRGTPPRPFRRARPGTLRTSSRTLLVLLDDLLQIVAQRRDRLAPQLGTPPCPLADHVVERGEIRVLVRVVLAKVPAAALLALELGGGDRLGAGQQAGQIERR